MTFESYVITQYGKKLESLMGYDEFMTFATQLIKDFMLNNFDETTGDDKMITKEKAIDVLEGSTKGVDGELFDAIRMALEALKAQEPDAECEACIVHYQEDEA